LKTGAIIVNGGRRRASYIRSFGRSLEMSSFAGMSPKKGRFIGTEQQKTPEAQQDTRSTAMALAPPSSCKVVHHDTLAFFPHLMEVPFI